ncbi:phage antirepressor KilAC domain-containing protein [Paracidovorax cattleyae]|uniref:Phage antirepressor protein YoqD, KilAC domain n=1 Tax=Paracidovorax cattleyae TaxID=80868 RepID=A0A1H0RGG9_9BURK|nr:phage antirepressor KilAC domain-containing protein [Paracidovorax cattleyae]SDP28531.1 Phage antirepressor protein YoqD, KilAC domain [Paracidovorax cattleyae]
MDVVTTSGSGLTMSSREIAELTGKRHDNVMPVCRSLRDAGVCPEIQETPCTNPQNGQTYMECRLNKRDSLVLIARLSPDFTARVVDRWQELEAQAAPAIPRTMAQALRLAADQAEQIELQRAQLEEAAPKVEYVDRFVAAHGAMGFRQVAKLLRANEHEFRAFLQEEKVMYRLGGEWTAYQAHIDAGRFVVRSGVATANEHAFSTTKFTPKGVEWVAGLWGRHTARRAQEAS